MSTRKYTGWTDERLQKRILGLIDRAGHKGLCVAELRMLIPDTEAHHGWISGALSVLHADLKIARLKEKRLGCKVYVEPDFLDSREAEAQGRGGPSKDDTVFAMRVIGFLEYWLQVDTAGARFTTDKSKAERNPFLFFRELRALWIERPE